MTEPVKIAAFEAENVKRVRAVELQPSPDGLTVIGGRNSQGKTSVLDAIAWALGGNRMRPSDPRRSGSMVEPSMRAVLSNGVVVERKGEKGSLKVTDPSGQRAGQALLDSFIGELSLDLPRFMAMTGREKAEALLACAGCAEELARLEAEERAAYSSRTEVGRLRDRKRAAAEAMPHHDDAPDAPVDASDAAERLGELRMASARREERERALSGARERREAAQRALDAAAAEEEEASRALAECPIADRAAIEACAAAVERADVANAMIRDNERRREAMAEADALDAEAAALTQRVEAARRAKMELLEGAAMPLPGLSVDGGEVVYMGRRWDCMSGSEQLRVAASIARAQRPECGFVLVDKLEQMDPQTLSEFGEWAREQGLQVIGTRVGTGGECSIVIEDGRAVEPSGRWEM